MAARKPRGGGACLGPGPHRPRAGRHGRAAGRRSHPGAGGERPLTEQTDGEREKVRSSDELALTLWLVAVLLAQFVLVWWFFDRLYAG